MTSVTSIVTSPSCIWGGCCAGYEFSLFSNVGLLVVLKRACRMFLDGFQGVCHGPVHDGALELSLHACLYLYVQGSLKVKLV